MKKILLSLLSIGAVAVIAVVATGAFFSDTETSTDNIFESGSIDLKIDNTSYLNGVLSQNTTWTELRDLSEELFFDFHDLKPGDEGEDTVSLHVFDNDAWACVDLSITANDDATDEPSDIDCTDPESDVDDCLVPPEPDGDLFDGELASELIFLFWVDDGDNVFEAGETILTGGPADAVLGGVTWTLADALENNVGGVDGTPLTGSQDYFIGKAWCYGSLTPDPVVRDPADQTTPADGPSGVLCDGSGVDNASQTDMLKGNIVFRAEQARNNDTFDCQEQAGPTLPQ